MFSHLTTCKALFSLTNCHQKHQMPQHTKCNIITQMLINSKGRNTYFKFVDAATSSSKALRKERQHVIFNFFFLHISSHKTTFTSITHVYLLPGSRMLPSFFLFGTSPGRWWRHFHLLRRGGRYLHHLWRYAHHFFITAKARNHQLTHD